MHVHVYTTLRQTNRQTETDRQTEDRQTETDRDRDKEKEGLKKNCMTKPTDKQINIDSLGMTQSLTLKGEDKRSNRAN